MATAVSKGEPLPYERLADLPLTEMAYKESLRLNPPAPGVSRCVMRDTEFAGYKLPAGSRVNINSLFTHHMPELWPEPGRFDPGRFADASQSARHRWAFVPFGGGAHMCLGLHFAYMQAKCFARHLLQNLVVRPEPGYVASWTMWPIPQPKDGLRLSMVRV